MQLLFHIILKQHWKPSLGKKKNIWKKIYEIDTYFCNSKFDTFCACHVSREPHENEINFKPHLSINLRIYYKGENLPLRSCEEPSLIPKNSHVKINNKCAFWRKITILLHTKYDLKKKLVENNISWWSGCLLSVLKLRSICVAVFKDKELIFFTMVHYTKYNVEKWNTLPLKLQQATEVLKTCFTVC